MNCTLCGDPINTNEYLEIAIVPIAGERYANAPLCSLNCVAAFALRMMTQIDSKTSTFCAAIASVDGNLLKVHRFSERKAFEEWWAVEQEGGKDEPTEHAGL